jgi:hypothetical protein
MVQYFEKGAPVWSQLLSILKDLSRLMEISYKVSTNAWMARERAKVRVNSQDSRSIRVKMPSTIWSTKAETLYFLWNYEKL